MRKGLLGLTGLLIGLSVISTVSSTDLLDRNGKTNKTPIEHVIVLMLENRAFDHMLGFLKASNPEITGCLPNESKCSNPINPTDPDSPTVTVDDTAVYQQVSPSHSISGTTQQIYGTSTGTEANMNGFISSYNKVDKGNGEHIMKCFSPEHIPAMANLTMEYLVFDGWFSSVPGPTMVNRAYAASGTSHGMGTNDKETIAKGLPQKTMFRQLLEMGLDYRVYFQLVPTLLMFKDMRHKEARTKYRGFEQFFVDVAAGDLPEFTWLEPSYYTAGPISATDQHPDHDVSLGDALVKSVYDAVRSSVLWNKTALIVTYDEHGGFFDHVSPPAQNVPNPDGLNSVDDPFDFTRLGVRVPTIVISPWVKAGSVVHAPQAGAGQYEHSSLLATVVHKLFGPKIPGLPQPDYLTKRDAWAATFEGIFKTLKQPRSDCPWTAPAPADHQQLAPHAIPAALDGSAPLTDLQVELLAIVAGATEDATYSEEEALQWSEDRAGRYVAQRMNIFFGYDIVKV